MLQIPRFAFEKFPGSKAELSTQMKSVGEAMAMGRTFQESFQKALRSLETGLDGFSLPKNWKRMTDQQLIYGLRVPNPDRMMVMKQVSCCTSTYAQFAACELRQTASHRMCLSKLLAAYVISLLSDAALTVYDVNPVMP